jgi:hypothetical protein
LQRASSEPRTFCPDLKQYAGSSSTLFFDAIDEAEEGQVDEAEEGQVDEAEEGQFGEAEEGHVGEAAGGHVGEAGGHIGKAQGEGDDDEEGGSSEDDVETVISLQKEEKNDPTFECQKVRRSPRKNKGISPRYYKAR